MACIDGVPHLADLCNNGCDFGECVPEASSSECSIPYVLINSLMMIAISYMTSVVSFSLYGSHQNGQSL